MGLGAPFAIPVAVTLCVTLHHAERDAYDGSRLCSSGASFRRRTTAIEQMERMTMPSELHLKKLARQALARMKAVRLERAKLKIELGSLKSELQYYRERLFTWRKPKGPKPAD
jgi:hypothetical protein